ncbi:DUF4097 family beta strand repeat protein [Echinicola sp. CAU 1574]|uniref:DUF4097 family beta strand repeat protein n=1 Tax=Echinicola arenosa TaxID=2774144 RepID=A0ABR9AHY5_9BACT|nr:DUF4097 family beta strand repeat-containing protein [Echinicola arenosa]MBD8488124.1 DUF4097 family beta strand repeat protein [Echinicola arenosa]
MKTLTNTLRIAFLFLFLGIASSYGQSKIQKSFENISKLEIQGGSIEISYEGNSSQSDIQVEADMGSTENADKNLIFITVGNTLKISYQTPSNSWKSNDRGKKYVHISGPKNIELSASNSSGKLHVKGVSSPSIDLKASSGMILVEDIEGELNLAGSSGKVEARNISGEVNCKMTSGIMELEYIKGNTNLSSSSGKIKAQHISGELNVKITSGSVDLEDISTLGELKLSSGMMSAKKVGFGPNTSFMGSSGAFKIKAAAMLDQYNYDMSAGSGMVKVGKMSSSDHLVIDHDADHTIIGKIGSGMISIEEY